MREAFLRSARNADGRQSPVHSSTLCSDHRSAPRSDPETVAEKILRIHESLGGIARLTFQMSVADLPHAKLMRAIELLGTRVAPFVRTALASGTPALSSTKSERAA